MSEQQSIRDQLAQVIAVGDGARGHMVLADDELVADQIMASPVIRRIQADAIRRTRDELGVDVSDNEGEYWDGYRQGQRRQFAVLGEQADRIEKGEDA